MQDTASNHATRRTIVVRQKGYYFLWFGWILVAGVLGFLAYAVLTGHSASELHGRGAARVKLLIYALPVLAPLWLALLVWLIWFFTPNYPRRVEIDSSQVTILTRSGREKKLDALSTRRLVQDKYGNVSLFAEGEKAPYVIPRPMMKKADREWVTGYLNKLVQFQAQEGKPIRVG